MPTPNYIGVGRGVAMAGREASTVAKGLNLNSQSNCLSVRSLLSLFLHALHHQL